MTEKEIEEMEREERKKEIEDNKEKMEVDMEDIERERKQKMEEENKRESNLCSEVIKKKLPRVNLTKEKIEKLSNLDYKIKNKYVESANEMIKEEIIKLIKKDNMNYPFKGMTVDEDMEIEEEDEIDIEEKELIEQLINEEVENLKKIPHKKQSELNLSKEIEKVKEELYKKEKSINEKLVKKNDILTHGYKKNIKGLYSEYVSLVNEINELKEQKKIYGNLLNEENNAYLNRKRNKENELRELEIYESELQNKYKIKN